MRKTAESRRNAADTRPRTDVLKEGLLERRRQLQDELRDRIRTGRIRGAQEEGTDNLEHSEQDVQNELAISLLQMRSETLLAIDAALGRLDSGGYGFCADCQREITTRRLRALPFAARCQVCEREQEDSRNEAARGKQGRGSLSRFAARSGA